MGPVSHFIQIEVEEHDALPDGCSMRFRASGEAAPVRRVRYESEDGREGIWRIVAEHADGATAEAMAIEVEDSSAGTATLIYGGAHGLRLLPEGEGEPVAEPYLLLTPSAVVP